MGGKSAAPTTTTQTSAPPEFLQPGLEQAAGAAQELFAGGPQQFFPGSTVVPLAGETEEALTGIAGRAREGGQLTPAAQEQLLATIQGRGVNPFLGGAVDAATAPLFERFQQETIPGLTSAFAGAGRSGSPAEGFSAERAATALGRGVSEQASRLAFGSAEAEAARQQAAIGAAPGLDAAGFADLQRLAQVGGVRGQQAGLELQAEIDRFQFGQQAESQRINQLINQLNVLGGGLGTVSKTGVGEPGSNKALTGLGGAAAGATLGATLAPATAGASIPIGALLGAITGGGIGFFG